MKKQTYTPARSITPEIEGLLNKQIVMEGKSSAAYLSMASWCDTQGFEISAEFLYKHSEEERRHMQWKHQPEWPVEAEHHQHDNSKNTRGHGHTHDAVQGGQSRGKRQHVCKQI